MTETRTIRDVELVKVGDWEASSGTFSPRPADLESAVAAHRAGILRKPVVKLGHVDERFDGEPSFGHIDNLRIVASGQTLIGDLVGIPAWLADALPVHYPDRSIEGMTKYEDPDGKTWSFVLTGCALLGATAPAISTLESLQSLIAARALHVPGLGAARAVVIPAPVAARVASASLPGPHRTSQIPGRDLVTIAAARRRRRTRKVL